MMLRTLMRTAALIVAMLGVASGSNAAPITYLQTGTSSGTLGGVTFTNAATTLMATGDTANVVAFFIPEAGDSIFINAVTTRVNIAGLGTALITQPTAVYAFPFPVQFEEGMPLSTFVVFGTIDHPPALDSFTGLGGSGNAAFAGYDLRTSLGPITSVPGGVGRSPSQPVSTNMGTLTFNSDIGPTTQGTFTATVSQVPEPTSMWLLGSALTATFARRARRR